MNLDFPDFLEKLVEMANLDSLVLRVKLDTDNLVFLVFPDQRVNLDSPVLLVLKVLLVFPLLLLKFNPEPPDKMDFLVFQVLRVNPDTPANLEKMDFLVFLDSPDLKETLDSLDNLDKMAVPDSLERKELTVS